MIVYEEHRSVEYTIEWWDEHVHATIFFFDWRPHKVSSLVWRPEEAKAYCVKYIDHCIERITSV